MDDLSSVYFSISKLRGELEKVKDSRAKSLVLTKIDEAEMWLDRCEPKEPEIRKAKEEFWKPASEQ